MSEIQSHIDALEARYKAKPYDTETILALIPLYESPKNWERVNQLLKRLSELEENPSVRAKYFFSMGQVYESFLKDPYEATTAYAKCIDTDPSRMVAFDHLVQLLRSQKEWRKVEREYRKMLRRLEHHTPQQQGECYRLNKELGELYEREIGTPAAAMEQYRKALQHNPTSLEVRLQMAALYTSWEGPDRSGAKQLYEEILEMDPFNHKNMQLLFRYYWEDQDYDRAWCLSALMVGLKSTDLEATRFYTQHKPRGIQRLGPGSLDTLWEHLLLSTPEDYEIGQLFSALADIVPVIHGATERSLGVVGHTPASPQGEGPTFNDMFYYVVEAFGFPPPTLYLLPEVDQGLGHHAIIKEGRLCKVITVGHQLLSGHMEQDLAFILGSELLYLLPGYAIIRLLSRTALVTLALGAIKLANPRILFGEHERIVNTTANQIADLLPDPVLDHLRDTLRDLAATGRIPDIDGFIDRTRLLAHRVGFVLCQDINTAFALMERECWEESPISLEAAKRALITFAATKNYFEIRRRLAITID